MDLVVAREEDELFTRVRNGMTRINVAQDFLGRMAFLRDVWIVPRDRRVLVP